MIEHLCNVKYENFTYDTLELCRTCRNEVQTIFANDISICLFLNEN